MESAVPPLSGQLLHSPPKSDCIGKSSGKQGDSLSFILARAIRVSAGCVSVSHRVGQDSDDARPAVDRKGEANVQQDDLPTVEDRLKPFA